ncbi:MAG: ABC transporter permease [Bryobacteraceae bacterium]
MHGGKLLFLACTILGAIVLAGILAPLITPYGPFDQNLDAMLERPSLRHPLGTDELGRDVLARLVYGARYVMGVAIWGAALPICLGIPVGLLTGFSRRWSWLDWVVEALMPLPDLLLTLLVASLLGPSLNNALFALSITYTPVIARLVRSEVRQASASPFVLRLRASGVSGGRIITQHLLRHAAGPVLIQSALNLGAGVTVTAGLGYLGLGAQPPLPEWGAMLNSAVAHLSTRPAIAGSCALMIAVTSLSLQLIGEEAGKMMGRHRARAWNPFLHATAT